MTSRQGASSHRRDAETSVALAPNDWLPDSGPDPLLRAERSEIGDPVPRIDGPDKVTGRAPFAGEIPMEGMVYASIVHSTIARGRLTGIDYAAAEAAPGVVLVMTHKNAPRLKPPPLMQSSLKAGALDLLPVMQDDRVHWNGQPVAVVAAQSQEQADHAASLLAITYESEAAATDFEQAVRQGAEPVMIGGQPLRASRGDAQQAYSDAVVHIETTYSTPGFNHNAIELHTVTAAWQGDCLRVHDASQQVTHTAWSLSDMFDIDEADVIVTSPYVGGGFGGKMLWQHQVLAAALAKLVARPVRLVVSREGVYRLVGGRSRTVQRVALGAGRDGRLRAFIHDGVSPTSRSSIGPEAFILSSFSAYAAEALLIELQTVHLDMLSNSMMRAPGEAVGTFALECAMDELAHETGVDPVELRIRNEPTTDPVSGRPFAMRNIVEAWHKGADEFGWSHRNPVPRSVRDGEWLVGLGCAMATHAYHRRPGGAARITVTRDGRAIVDVAAHEMGMGTATVQSTICAERLGLPRDAISFNYGDSRLPGVVLAGSSHQTAVIGAAVVSAQRKLVEVLLELAGDDSPLAGVHVDEVACRDAGLCALDDPRRYDSYAAILSRAQRESASAEASSPEPQEERQWSMRSYGALFCEVRVNTVTGEPRVTRFLGHYDCGRILNAKTASSQLRGGIIMGLGMALMEETQVDGRTGRIMNAGLADYHIPVHMDVPVIDVAWTDIPDPHTPMGAHGIGEIGITGVAAAVANAIFNATGKRVRDLPITLDKLL